MLDAREVRAARSVLLELEPKLLKKAISKLATKKKFKLSLSYHEAHFLEKFIAIANTIQYSRHLQMVIDKLDQKLV